MSFLFCNITKMKYYKGITEQDTPFGGGSYVTKNQDAHEQWNFLNDNGYCYGFVQNRGEKFAIERINPIAKRQSKLEGVTVVWCAKNGCGDTVVVGWYENATVYREYQVSRCTPAYGFERDFFVSAKAEDCYLLSEENRTFVIGRASQDGRGRGFGQENFWYAESAYANEELIPSMLEFLESHKKDRINETEEAFSPPENVDTPLTDEEKGYAEKLFNDHEDSAFLPYGYRLYHESHSADHAYNLGEALAALCQYTKAIHWYSVVLEIEGNTWDVNSKFPYLYQQCGDYEKSIESAKALLDYDEAQNESVRDEIYGIIADGYFYSHCVEDAIAWLDKIISESSDENYVEFTRNTKTAWKELL